MRPSVILVVMEISANPAANPLAKSRMQPGRAPTPPRGAFADPLNSRLSHQLSGLPARPGDEVMIFIPNKDRDGVLIDQGFWREKALTLFGELFGGATAMHAEGVFRTESGTLIREQSIVLFCHLDMEQLKLKAPLLEGFLRQFCKESNQEEVGFSVNRHYIGIREVNL